MKSWNDLRRYGGVKPYGEAGKKHVNRTVTEIIVSHSRGAVQSSNSNSVVRRACHCFTKVLARRRDMPPKLSKEAYRVFWSDGNKAENSDLSFEFDHDRS